MLLICCRIFASFFSFLFCFVSIVMFCTGLKLILKGCFDSTFDRGEFNHIVRVIQPAGGMNQTDLIKQNSRMAKQCQQSKTRGQVKHWRHALYAAGWLAALPFGGILELDTKRFEIMKCMIYREEKSAEVLGRGNFFHKGKLLWTCWMGQAIPAQWQHYWHQSICFQFSWRPMTLLCEIAGRHIVFI